VIVGLDGGMHSSQCFLVALLSFLPCDATMLARSWES